MLALTDADGSDRLTTQRLTTHTSQIGAMQTTVFVARCKTVTVTKTTHADNLLKQG